MINIDQYEYIRIEHRVYRKNISEIERETGHGRKTIRKVLNGEYSGYSQKAISTLSCSRALQKNYRRMAQQG